MFFQKIRSDEYLQLKQLIDTLKLEVTSLSLDLQLYTKKLKASKGLNSKEDETEKDINQQLVPV
jgi:hypothetical protein